MKKFKILSLLMMCFVLVLSFYYSPTSAGSSPTIYINNGWSEEFLKLVQQKYSVISVGANNSYGHPTALTD